MSFRLLFVVVVCFFVAACGGRRGGGYYSDDGPPDRPHLDIAKLEDAVPRYESPSSSGNEPYQALGRWYHPLRSARGYHARGAASWYGRKFHGRRTSSGERYDMFAMTAAHRTLPLPSYVRVMNLRNGRSVVVKVNDRGPFLHNRLIDLSYAAAYKLGIIGTGTGLVDVTAVFPNSSSPQGAPAETMALRPVIVEPRIFLQLGAFADVGNAQRLRDRLLTQGFRSTLDPVRKNGLNLYRVRLGPLTDVESADEKSALLRDRGFDPQLVVE